MTAWSRVTAGLGRRFGSWPLRVLSPRLRAEVLANASAEAVRDVATPAGPMRFDVASPLLLSRAESALEKEPDTIHWIDGFAEGAVLWDIGANVGVFSLYAAVARKARVLAFEPSGASFHALARNVQLNALGERVVGYCLAFAGRTELGMLNMASAEMGASMSVFGRAGVTSRYWEGESASAVQGVVGFTVDEFVARFAPPFPEHVKLDVDGLEPAILEGATTTLRDPRLRSVLVEISLTDSKEREGVLALLRRAGLELVSQGAVQGTATHKAANHLFVRDP